MSRLSAARMRTPHAARLAFAGAWLLDIALIPDGGVDQ